MRKEIELIDARGFGPRAGKICFLARDEEGRYYELGNKPEEELMSIFDARPSDVKKWGDAGLIVGERKLLIWRLEKWEGGES